MKLLLADDHTLFREALEEYIRRAEPSVQIVLAKDFHEVLSILKEATDFDLVLLDMKMPGMMGLSGFSKIREDHPTLRLVLISGLALSEDVQQAMDMGAVGYFPKTMSGKAMIRAIQLVLSGEIFVPVDSTTNQIMPSHVFDRSDYSSAQGALESYKLTAREIDVLNYLAKGSTNKDIAEALGVQIVTIKLHVRGICKKLGAANRTQAALKAKELGIFT